MDKDMKKNERVPTGMRRFVVGQKYEEREKYEIFWESNNCIWLYPL